MERSAASSLRQAKTAGRHVVGMGGVVTEHVVSKLSSPAVLDGVILAYSEISAG